MTTIQQMDLFVRLVTEAAEILANDRLVEQQGNEGPSIRGEGNQFSLKFDGVLTSKTNPKYKSYQVSASAEFIHNPRHRDLRITEFYITVDGDTREVIAAKRAFGWRVYTLLKK